MGDIKSRSFNNEINQTEELKKALLESLERNPGKKQVIQLNGKSSLLFGNLTALTLASCGGGGGGSSAPAAPSPTSSFSISNQSINFTEDTPGSFNILTSGSTSDSFTITVQSIPTEGTLTLASGTVLSVGASLTLSDLEGIIFTPNENVNSEADTIGDFVLDIVDNTVSSTARISLIVSAVNDAPVVGTQLDVEVFENIDAGSILLTVTGSDVDNDTLTYSLTGADANLFSVDADGNISFIASPNFSSPGDTNADNRYQFDFVATDADGLTASTEISIFVLNISPKGQAIDGYLVGATVWVDLDGDGIKDENEPETTTDKTGAFEFTDDIPADTNIYVQGGYDLGTGKPNEQTFKLTTSTNGDGSEALIVSPVSTQISRAYSKSGVSLEQAQEKIGKAYGLDAAFDNLTNFDPIALAYTADSNTQAQAALTAQARNIMVSSLGELSKKVSEYFSTEITPTTRTQITDIFKFGTQTLRYSSWDSGVDLETQPRIVIELDGLEDLLDSTSDTFNDKIVEAILASEDLTKIFEMKADGSGQFDQVINNATSAIILEIKNIILSEMGFDPATNFTTFKSLDGYTGETVTFLGSTKTLGEWAVLMVDVLDSQQPDPYLGRVNFGPDGGVTDMVGKYYAEQMVKMVRLMETMTGLTFENLTDSQIDQIVDMGFEYNRASTFNDSYSRWIPFDEFGQELWSQAIYLNYSGERLRYDSNGNEIQGNTGQWQLTADQVKAYLKDPTTQLNDGNWGNDFTTYNWTVKTGDLGIYLALAEGRTPDEVTTLLNSVSASSDAITNFNEILTASFTQATKVFTNLVTGALDFTLDKFTSFVEKQIDYRNDEQILPKEAFGIPVSTIETVTIPGEAVDQTIVVTVVNDGNGNKFYFDGVLAPNYTFDIGATYTFDTSDSSNSGHPFRLSTTKDGTHGGGTEYTSGVTFNSGSVVLTVDSNTPTTLYYYCQVHSGMSNDAVLNSQAVAGKSFELETVSGIGYMVNGDALNPDVQESGDFSYAITGGADKDLFRVSDNGSLSFKDAAPDPSNPNDSNADGEYIVEITITDNSDNFQQVVEFVMEIPDWDYSRTYSTSTKPTLTSNVINVEEHSIMRAWSSYDPDTLTNTEIYNGIELQIDGLEGLDPSLNVNVWLPDRDDAGNKIKDNSMFYLNHEDGKYYLSLRDGNSLDFEDPKDSNGDNVYELLVNIEIHGNGVESVGTRADLLFVVNSNSNDPAVTFPDWWEDEAPNHFSVAENQAAVATLTDVTIAGTTQQNVFVVGDVWNIDHQPGVNPQTIEELQAITFAGSVTSTITGGADADKFLVRDTDWGTQVFFANRPVFSSPADADGDNIYEFNLTKTAADGSSITKTVRIEVREKDEGSLDPIATPASPLVFIVDEIAEKLDTGEGSRNVLGTDGDDIFVRENYGFQYIDGGAGNDNFDNFREGYLTGGAGADIFQLSGEHLENPLNFGIRDYAKNFVEGAAEGINGYDENRDGVLDLATELNWTRVALISDFTPGEDTLALTTLGWTGNNVPNLSKADISFVQGTGDLSAHTFVMLTGKRAEDQGLTEGGIIAVLLDIDASTISKDTDVTEVGPQYDNVLGNIKDAIGASVTTIQDGDGRDTPILQLPDGQFVWLGLDYTEFDNASFFQNFAVASDGTLYVPRSENLDFEDPKDGNKDNIYELLFTGSTFTSIQLRKQEWGGYDVDWENSERTGNIAFKVFININDVISDNVGKLSIAETDFFSAADAQTGDAALDTKLVDLVLSQISAVQGSLMDIDFKAIAEEINFDFAFFSTADQQTQAEEWFGDYQENRFSDFNRELESTFERNLLSKFSSYTNADSLTNLTGTAEADSLTGTDVKETIFGKKGDDTILGGAGDDVIFGDQGADILDGGAGADAIDGGAGDDTIKVGEGLDVLDGGSGNDKFDFTNITSLPEFIKGGSGTDTLVLSGLSSVGLEVDDGTDADSLPDYTGIDLNKLVSVKETWTYEDESGNTVNEEGWRNRVESIEKIDLRDSQSSIVDTLAAGASFGDVLNITWDALQRMSWDNRTWTIRGDDTDTVRLLGHEYSYNEGSTIKTQFEAFRAKGTTVEDGITYNVYELWDGRVHIEQGITVIHTKRDLGKAVAGENTQPDFWYQYTTVYENSTTVFGAVKDSWDADGDTITYSLDVSYPDAALFDINATTGEVTFKVAPNYEAPVSISTGASSVGTSEADFSSFDQNMLRMYNQYQIRVIGDDGSGESNATNSYIMYIDVRNLPDYAGYDSTNKIPFFKDMWGSDSKFIDDAADQSIQIKGFDLDFDALTWTLIGVSNTDGAWGEMEGGETGGAIADAPLQLSSTGVVTPKSTLSYEDGKTWFNVYVQITDGKSTAVKKQFYFQVEDTLGDGSLTVSGTAMVGSYSLASATVWQDLDNDGIKDAGEPTATTEIDGRFNLSVSKSDTDAPILASGGYNAGTGVANTSIYKINSNLKLTSGRDWGEYSLSPMSSVALSMQNIDRSILDKTTVTDSLKAFGMDPLWMEGDGNFYGERFYDIKNRLDGQTSVGEWELFNLNIFTLNNLLTIVSDTAAKTGMQVITDALADVNTKVSATSNVTGYTAATLTTAQQTSIKEAASQALIDSVAEVITGQTSYDGFRLAKTNPVTITDHEGSQNVVHTPTYSVSSNVLTLDSSEIQVNQAALQDALDLKAGSKGLKIEVEVGTLPSTAQTIEFTGKLIDGTNSTIDSGERAIEIKFQVLVDPTQEVGSAQYVYVPDSSDLTVIYTGEDGTTTSTIVDHGNNMVTVETSTTGVPKFVVDFTKVFAKGIPETNLSTYFTTSTASNGDYYMELDFTGATLTTSAGESFTKVVAPFKVAATTTPVVYLNDITVSEARGWNQIELKLSKPATETFTIEYNLDSSGTATQNDDFWWWSDETGYRSVTFVQGQSSAVINVDVRNDSVAESDETIVYGLRIASGSEGKVVLPKNTVTVTIDDDESASSIDLNSVVDKMLTKLSTTLATELKTLTDANSADLSSSSTSFTNILLSNTDISDISTYLSGEISDDVTLYSPIAKAVMELINTYVMAVRGPSGIQDSLKIDGSEMAKDMAALSVGFNTLNLSEFTSTASADLNAALINDIYTDSGFKYTGATTALPAGGLAYVRTIDTDSSAYANLLFPTGEGLRDTSYQQGAVTFSEGTSGNDTINLNTANTNVLYQGFAGNDDITLSDDNSNYMIFGGAGDDIIKDANNSGNTSLLDGGDGNDTLYSNSQHQIKMTGGNGNDVFVIEYNTGWKWDSGNSFNGNDSNQDLSINFDEYYSIQGVITDFQDGSDKIGLRGSDWSGKTIVVQQGTGTMSNHTFLLTGAAERGGDSDYQYWLILWNTTASSITSDDFVLVDANYATSSLSGVTISTNISDAGLETEDSALNSGNDDIENAFYVTGLVDDSPGFEFGNLDNPDPVLEVANIGDLLSDQDITITSDDNSISIIDEIYEEEILISIDIV